MPLILSSNIIWHAYRLKAETKIFRLGVSLIYLLYVKEEWTGKKVYCRKTEYITSNTNNFDKSTQINIKLFTVYEYIIEHEYILLSKLVSHSNNYFQLVLFDQCP